MNCKNCGAPVTVDRCEYCGTAQFFAEAVEARRHSSEAIFSREAERFFRQADESFIRLSREMERQSLLGRLLGMLGL